MSKLITTEIGVAAGYSKHGRFVGRLHTRCLRRLLYTVRCITGII